MRSVPLYLEQVRAREAWRTGARLRSFAGRTSIRRRPRTSATRPVFPLECACLGHTVFQANSTLASRGLKLGGSSEGSSDTIRKGHIIEQRPDAGTEVQTNTSVSITISSGPSTVEVPDLVSKSRDEAENILDAAGLRLGRTAKSWSDDVPEDMIVEQNRAPRGKVERGSFVNITVSARRGRVRPGVLTAGLVVVVLLSTGGIFLYRNLVTPQPQTTPQLQTLVVPNLVGMDEEEAAQRVGDDFSMSVSSAS